MRAESGQLLAKYHKIGDFLISVTEIGQERTIIHLFCHLGHISITSHSCFSNLTLKTSSGVLGDMVWCGVALPVRGVGTG